MSENYVTRDEFNGYTKRNDAALRDVSMSLVAVETKVDMLPDAIQSKNEVTYSKIMEFIATNNQGNAKWTASTIVVPFVLFLMGIISTIAVALLLY